MQLLENRGGEGEEGNGGRKESVFASRKKRDRRNGEAAKNYTRDEE